MSIEYITNNQVKLAGMISSKFMFSHEYFGEGFYTFYLTVNRISGISDVIPITISERLIDVKEDYTGEYVYIYGQYRSYNKRGVGKNRLLLSVFATNIFFAEDEKRFRDTNFILLTGFVCKQPTYRTTPLGREISDLLIAVNRPYARTDYIPCITWGRNARYSGHFDVGDIVTLEGRIQSREYSKKLDNGTYEIRTAYEVSVSRIEVIKESEENTNESGSEENV